MWSVSNLLSKHQILVWHLYLSLVESIRWEEGFWRCKVINRGRRWKYPLPASRPRLFPSVQLILLFLSDPGVPGPIFVSGCLSVCLSVRHRGCWDLTDVTLADEDTNSILTDNANRAIQGNVRKSYLVRKGILWEKVFLWEKVI